MTAEIICVGTELLLGSIVNTNAAFIAKECATMGINVYAQSVVGDNAGRLREAFLNAFNRSDVVILSGGLGPTEDDLTKETIAEALGIELVEDKKARKMLESYFDKIDKKMTDNNYKQALVPKKSIVLYNDNGTAPGIAINKDNKAVVLLPGPPKELIPMFKEQVRPILAKKSGDAIFSITIKECGIGESELETILIDLIDGQTNPTIATYAKDGRCEIRITAFANKESEAKEIAKPIAKQIKARLGDAVYSCDEDEDLENSVINLLKKYDLKISTAESCTGGLIASKLVNVPGASDVFTHGFITYSNKAKRKILSVDRDTLKKYSAVSKEVAKEMAKGCAFVADTEVSIAVTGYAGPYDSKEEPKGLVYIACSVNDKVIVNKFNFNGDRNKIRENAAIKALNMVRTSIIEAYR